MLLKEKLLLSNCDSVRCLSPSELRKRFLTGMTFGEGVVISPNILIDNLDFHRLLSRRNIVKYLNEEGHGALVLRGFNLSEGMSLLDYYEALPSHFILSSVKGSPTKSSLSKWQESDLIERIKATQKALSELGYLTEKLELSPDSLTKEVSRRLHDDSCIGHFFEDDGERTLFYNLVKEKISRSEWYNISDGYFGKKSELTSRQFKAEVIDPAYNSLFAKKGEGFLQDNIKYINDVPEIILDASVSYRSLRKEIELVEYAFKIFEIISTIGTTELSKLITDQAMDYIEGKMSDRGEDYFSRKNWFGMYKKMQCAIGLELK